MAKRRECISCNEFLPDDACALTCSECNYPYHLGACSGVSEASFKSKSDALRKSWRCATCRTAKLRSGQGSKQKIDADLDVPGMLVNINRKLDELLSLKETVNGIESSIQHMSEKYDELLASVQRQDRDIKELSRRVKGIEEAETHKQLEKLKHEMNELEWHSRKMNLEVHGITTTENENLLLKINEVAKKLDVPELVDDDVVALHRLPSKPDKVPGIIVRFATQKTRDAWIEKRGVLRRTREHVYLQENMTKHNRALLWTVKEWARERQFQFAWHRNNKIFLRKENGARALLIRGEDDLRRLT